MKCLYCNSLESKVVDSRPTDGGLSIRRRRECINCAKRFTTYEKIEEVPLSVIKRDGSRQPFISDKILFGLRKSCVKRPISESDIENLVDEVMRECFNSLEPEVSTSQIGEMVLRKLKEIDEVAYIRFASVYRSFDDIPSFLSELNNLMDDKDDDSE